MVITIGTVFLIVALILFLLAAFNVSTPVNLVAAGLACVVIAMLIGGVALG